MSKMRQQRFAETYAQTLVETSVSEAKPHKLVEMLYEGVIKNLKIAKIFMEQENHEKKIAHINKTSSIIMHLKAVLDVEKGKEVAKNLYELYDYCLRNVLDASMHNKVEKLDEVLEYFEELHDSWNKIPNDYKTLTQNQIDNMG